MWPKQSKEEFSHGFQGDWDCSSSICLKGKGLHSADKTTTGLGVLPTCLHVEPLKTTENTNWEQSNCSLVVNYSAKSCRASAGSGEHRDGRGWEAGLAQGWFSCFPTFPYPHLCKYFRNILVPSVSQQNKQIRGAELKTRGYFLNVKLVWVCGRNSGRLLWVLGFFESERFKLSPLCPGLISWFLNPQFNVGFCCWKMNIAVPGKTVGMAGKPFPAGNVQTWGRRSLHHLFWKRPPSSSQQVGGKLGLHLLFLVTLQIEKEEEKKIVNKQKVSTLSLFVFSWFQTVLPLFPQLVPHFGCCLCSGCCWNHGLGEAVGLSPLQPTAPHFFRNILEFLAF